MEKAAYQHLNITKIQNEGNHLCLNCLDGYGYKRIFVVMGKENIRAFQKRMKKGDIINLLTHGPVVQRVTKAIDLEV